jgi:hypothetical protein
MRGSSASLSAQASRPCHWDTERLHHLEHRDPADRLPISTAIEHACPLVTYDKRIARLGKRRGSQYGFAVVSVDDDLHQGGLQEISESGAQCVVEHLTAVD